MLKETEVYPDGVVVIQPSQGPAVDQLLDAAHRARIDERVVDQQDSPATLRFRDQLGGLFGAGGHRLGDEDMLACPQRLESERVVGRHRRDDDDGVDGRVRDQRMAIGGGGDRRVPGMRQCQPFLAHIADCPNLRAGHLGKVTNDVGAPVAITDYPDSNRWRARHRCKPRVGKDVNRTGGRRTNNVSGHWFLPVA